MAVSLGPSCPCWRRPAASPPLKLWRGAGAAQEPPWLKADSPSLPVDGATLLTACCPGPPRSCGRRQRPARADHSFDRCTEVVSVPRLLGHTTDHPTVCHHHQAPSSYCVDGYRTPQQLSERTPTGQLNPGPRSYAIVSIHRGQNPPLFASLFSLCRLLQAACPHTFMSTALTMQLPLPAVCFPPCT